MSNVLNPDEIIREIFTESLLIATGNDVVAIIKERTLQGEFLEGSSPGASKYSAKTAPMPLGGLYARIGKTRANRVWKAIQEGSELGTTWRESRTKKIWLMLAGGYKRLRELSGRESDRVTLNWSGAMMRSLKVLGVDVKALTVTIGFTDPRSAELAGFHHQGAGRSRVKRIFLGLTEAEVPEAARKLQARIVVKR